MPCPKCGNTNRPVRGRCGYCGAELPAAAAPAGAPGPGEAAARPAPAEELLAGLRRGMALVPTGEFFMGSYEGEGEPDEHPRHRVLVEGFYIDRHPVTAGKFRAYCADAGAPMPPQPEWSTDDHPVINVDWAAAAAYCAWAGGRLPTEAEWERAARGGADTIYAFGDIEETKGVMGFAKSDVLGDYVWRVNNSSGELHQVGKKLPNQFGLYDMPGEVWEWVSDWYAADYYKVSPYRNPQGPASGTVRALKGGTWDYVHEDFRPAGRSGDYPGGGYGLATIGFRCVVPVPGRR